MLSHVYYTTAVLFVQHYLLILQHVNITSYKSYTTTTRVYPQKLKKKKNKRFLNTLWLIYYHRCTVFWTQLERFTRSLYTARAYDGRTSRRQLRSLNDFHTDPFVPLQPRQEHMNIMTKQYALRAVTRKMHFYVIHHVYLCSVRPSQLFQLYTYALHLYCFHCIILY